MHGGRLVLFIAALLMGPPHRSASAASVAQRLQGHWMASVDLAELHPPLGKTGWTVSLERVNAGDVSYEWGGPPAGLQFDADHHVAEYENVLCSTESDPVKDHDEAWRLEDRDRTLVISGQRRLVRLKIVALDRHHLKLRVIEVRATSTD
jgi:hypothetical protein